MYHLKVMYFWRCISLKHSRKCLCTCTHLEKSSHSLYTHGRARRCPHVPVWSRLSGCRRLSRYWSRNTSGAAAAQGWRRTAHHSLHSGTSARLHTQNTHTTLIQHPSHNSDINTPIIVSHKIHQNPWRTPSHSFEEQWVNILNYVIQH